MDVSGVFNKLRNTLSSTVSEISAALPGNPLLREYDAGNQVGSAGPHLLWKIYSGTKKSTKAEVSIWILEKKQLDQFNKADREIVLDIFRRGCVQLTKLRHPRVLIVEHGLEESRDSLCFCTEPVFASLANVLGKRTNIAEPPKDLQTYELHEIEIKYGLMQLSEALAFLHSGVKMVHGNVCPESIIINKVGAWKVAGFDFSVVNSGTPSDIQFQCKDFDTSLPPPSLPNPNYLAPEYILRKSCDVSSDLFSLGALLYAVYYKGKALLMSSIQDIYRNMPRNVDRLDNLSGAMLEKIPPEVREHEKMLLSSDPNVRPDAEQMAKLPFFNHVGVMTLQYLDTLLQRDNLQKSQFFKGLPKVLPNLPKRVVMYRVLPCLTAEFTNHDMIPFVLPSVMLIADDCSKQEFVRFVFPSLIPVFKVQKPIQVLLILLQKMELILSKTPADKIQNYVMPMLASAVGSPSLQIQELCMNIIPSFADQLEIQALKKSVLPKIRQISIEGETIAIRIHALVCIGKLVPSFDKWFVQDEILPFLHQITSREPGILMGILGVYRTVLNNDKLGISKQVMAGKSLPFLIPLSIENTLNLKQYSAFMNTIKEMIRRIEDEHRSKLEQLNKMQLEQDSSLDFTKQDSQKDQQSFPVESVDDLFNQKPKEEKTVSTASVARQHLTLEEKQKLAKMKEQENRMKKEGSLKPVNIAKPVSSSWTPATNKPKDLTSTLMQNNLQAMSLTSNNPTPLRPLGNMHQVSTASHPMGFTAQSQQLNSSRMPQSTMNWSNPSSAGDVKRSSFGVMTNPFLSPASQPMTPSLYSPQMNSGGFQHQQKSSSSFDDILSLNSSKKPSMNQMMTNSPMMGFNGSMASQNRSFMSQNTHMMPQNSTMSASGGAVNTSKSSDQLSKQDLLDFLG